MGTIHVIRPPTLDSDQTRQGLSLDKFTEISPWSQNSKLDEELFDIANDIRKVTTQSLFGTEEDVVFLKIERICFLASQMVAIFNDNPGYPTLSFEVVFKYLKDRVSKHLSKIIYDESKLIEMPFAVTPSDNLVAEILRDEMFTYWPEGKFEEALNDDYRRCLDLWNNGKRTYFASEDVQKWVGAMRSVDLSDGLNNHPIMTVAIGAVAMYTMPLSWTFTLLWTVGGVANAAIQYENAEIDQEYAEINGSPDAYENANRGYGQTYGMAAQAVLPVAARLLKSSTVAKQTEPNLPAPRSLEPNPPIESVTPTELPVPASSNTLAGRALEYARFLAKYSEPLDGEGRSLYADFCLQSAWNLAKALPEQLRAGTRYVFFVHKDLQPGTRVSAFGFPNPDILLQHLVKLGETGRPWMYHVVLVADSADGEAMVLDFGHNARAPIPWSRYIGEVFGGTTTESAIDVITVADEEALLSILPRTADGQVIFGPFGPNPKSASGILTYGFPRVSLADFDPDQATIQAP